VLEAITDQQLDALDSEHGGVYVQQTLQGPVYFKRPRRVEIDAALQKQKQGATLAAMADLCLRCVVHPSADEMRSLFDKFPLLSDDLGTAILAVARGDETALAKK